MEMYSILQPLEQQQTLGITQVSTSHLTNSHIVKNIINYICNNNIRILKLEALIFQGFVFRGYFDSSLLSK